jgi:rubrerythrin
MSAQLGYRSRSVVELLENVMEKEKEAVELYREKASIVDDPELRAVFLHLADMRIFNYKELESKLVKVKSEIEITNQINDMFY